MLRALCAFLSLLLFVQPAMAGKRIALSFDDVPRARGGFLSPDERTQRLIAALKAARVRQVAFFLNPGRLTQADGAGGEARIGAYVKAGHVIANHSFSHPALRRTSVADFLADIDKAEDWLKGRQGYRPWFRFPFLDEGRGDKAKRDAVRTGLKARGLRNGYVTIDASDWNVENLASQAQASNVPLNLAALRDHYVALHVEAANFYDDLARKTLGRSPAHVMLLHETDMAALYIADLVAALRADGWTIIPIDTAYKDRIGREMPDVPSAQGTLTEALAWQKGLAEPRWYEFNDVEKAGARFRRDVLGERKPQ